MANLFKIFVENQTSGLDRARARRSSGTGVLVVVLEQAKNWLAASLRHQQRLHVRPYPDVYFVLSQDMGYSEFERLCTSGGTPGLLAYKWISHDTASYREVQMKPRCTVHNEICHPTHGCKGRGHCICTMPPGETTPRCLGAY